MNLHGRRINGDLLSRTPTGYTASHGEDLCFVSDPYFRPTDLINSHDGGVLIADWSDTGECHEMDGVHRTTGRIYKLSYGEPNPRACADLARLNDAGLSEMQTHANDWYARQARRLLHERAHAKTLQGDVAKARLLSIFNESSHEVHRLRALWALHAIQDLDRRWMLQRLSDPHEHVRVWAVRLLGDSLRSDKPAADELVAKLGVAARKDDSGLVLLHMASILQRLPVEHRYELGRAILTRREPEFNRDKTLAIMLWLAIEPLVASDSAKALSLLRETSFPLVQENIARRLALEIDEALQPVEELLTTATADQSLARTILTGMAKAFEGRRTSPVPQNWTETSSRLKTAGDAATDQAVLELGALFRDREILHKLRHVAEDTSAPADERRRALRLVINFSDAELAPLLLTLINDPLLSVDALKGLAVIDGGAAPDAILDAYADLASEAKEAAIATLSSRRSSTRALLGAIKDGRLPRTEISAFHARQMLSLNDPEVTTELHNVWGDIRANSAEKKNAIDKLKSTLSKEALEQADVAAGRAVFARACANCHTLFGQGGAVGPDLTGSDRKNLTYLLENIVDPSAVVGVDYRAAIILLAEGRVVSGVVREQTERTVAVETPEGRQVFDRQDIEQINRSEVSVMPDGLLHGVTDREIVDLMAFLMSD
jgi:putative heme-binding domain-containing protein